MTVSTEWIKILALVALVALNSLDRVRPEPTPAPAPPPDAASVASGPSLAFPEAGTYVIKVQVGSQQGALVAKIDAPGTYPVSLAAQPR